MICEIDIWQAAQDLFRRYGADAARHAAIRADECRRADDDKSLKTWLEVLRVTSELRRMRAAENSRVTALPDASPNATIISLRRREQSGSVGRRVRAHYRSAGSHPRSRTPA